MKSIKTTFAIIFILTSLISLSPLEAARKLNVVTSMSVFEEVAKDIGGDRIKVSNIGPFDQELHFVILKPSHLHMLSKADLLVHTGLQGEPWLDSLLESAANQKLFPGNVGNCDASVNVQILEKPEVISREMGDVHLGGNPHFWMDPVNMITIGSNIKNKLIELMPEGKAEFESNFKSYAMKWKKDILGWAKRMRALPAIKVIDYHVSWSYFFKRFKMERIMSIEPKPGIKPSGSYLAKVIGAGKAREVDFVLAEPFFPSRDVEMVANEIGAPSLIIQQAPGGKFKTMSDVFEKIVSFIEGLKK